MRAAFRCYRSQDRDAAIGLYADDCSFTRAQDGHIDKAEFFARCFPTARRTSWQRLLHVTPADEELVVVLYEYQRTTGERYRDMEAIRVRDGLIREVQVFFGGAVRGGRRRSLTVSRVIRPPSGGRAWRGAPGRPAARC
uniref:nuclear transport factor 2 family protein n=1 Tax=Streptomyces sp. CHD11 TaxID=2741325 RepID=UPI0027E55CCB|nr:nuclear transport factor 2 family protein [Streptomyces sp. CHD11]